MLLADYYFYFLLGQLKSASSYSLSFIFQISSAIDEVKVKHKACDLVACFPQKNVEGCLPCLSCSITTVRRRMFLWTEP